MRSHSALLLAAVGLALAGCKGKEEPPPPPPITEAPAPTPAPPVAQVSVVGVTLGRAVGDDKKVTLAGDTFGPSDTIYASVDTQGAAPTAALSARWTFQDGQTVHEETQSIAPTGPATTEFHISKPDGWPKGSYTLEILLDGVSARRANFKVV